MSSRDAMLARIRSKVSKGDEDTRRAVVEAHLAQHRRNLIPARGQGDEEHRVRVFTEMMQAVGGSVEILDDINDVPHAVADYLRQGNLPAHVRRGADSLLATLPWHRGGTLEVAEGRAEESDRASITRAFAGVAESGTIVQISGPDNPTTLNFLPDDHIVVVDAADVVADYERVWTLLRGRYGKGEMPRTVNLVTGPSRSGDIEQILLMGAHGPRRVHIILVDRDETA